MAQLTQILIAVLIAAGFIAPAVFRPTLGRVVLSLMFIGGALFNLLYTLPHAPGSLEALVATVPIPPYREVVNAAVAWNVAPLLVLATIIFEATTGLMMLWRGALARLALLAAGCWGMGMLPVIPPGGSLLGIALTGAPGVAGLLLARRSYSASAYPIIARAALGIRPRAVLSAMIQPIPAILIFAAVWALFLGALHPWFMNWGSTPEEQAMALPGDTAAPPTYFTRAITVNAPSSEVWAWLLAIGQDRAGFLSNDYLENLTGADIHNVDTLRSEWLQRSLGDRVPMASPGGQALIGNATLTTIHLLEPERAIADTPGRFVLLPQGHSSTRLLLRESLDDPLRAGALWVLWDPMHFVMEQRMLQGIKERAEGQPFVPPVLQTAAHVGWALAGIGLLGIFTTRRGWRPWLLLPVGLMVLPFWLTGDVNSFLAGFLAMGITLAGFLAFGWRWLTPYLLVASVVALVLLLAPDSYAAFGLIFLVLATGIAGAFRGHLFQLVRFAPSQPMAAVSKNYLVSLGWTERLPVIRSLAFPFVLSSILAALLLISSIAGLLFGQRGLYQLDPATLPSFLTQDAITLFIAVPLLLTSLWLVGRGSVRGLLVWMGTLFYLAYAYSFAVLGTWLPPLFLLYVAIVSISAYSLIFVLVSTDAGAIRARFSAQTPVRWAAGFLMLMSLLLASLWVVMIVGSILSGTQPKSTLLVIWPLDLVIAFPALFWGGLWLWRRQALGYVVGGIMLMKATAEGFGLVAQTLMTLLMSGIGDDVLPAYVVIGVGGLILLVLYLRGLAAERSVVSHA